MAMALTRMHIGLVLGLLGLSGWVWSRLPPRTFVPDPLRSPTLRLPGSGAERATPALRVGVPASCFAGPALEPSAKALFAGPVVAFPNGKKALRALLAGEVDLAIAGDIPVAQSSLERDDFSVIGAASESSFSAWLVVRPEVREVSALRGKRIATQKNSGSHFVLGEALRRGSLSESQVTVVDMDASAMKPAFELGTIDAFAVEHAYVGDVTEHFGAGAAALASPGAYVHRFLLVARKDVLRARRTEVLGWLSAWAGARARWSERPTASAEALAAELRAADRAGDKGNEHSRNAKGRSTDRTVGECAQAAFLSGIEDAHIKSLTDIRTWFELHGQTKRVASTAEQVFDRTLVSGAP
jgi:ABC-type nitrate/sulfonate/bicarbonate transport system substrate-binding protein